MTLANYQLISYKFKEDKSIKEPSLIGLIIKKKYNKILMQKY